MKQWRAVVGAVLCLAAFGAWAPARSDDASVRRELQAIYARYEQSIKAPTSAALIQWIEQYVTPDALNVMPGGQQQTRQQLLDAVRDANWERRPTSSKGKITKLTVNGNRATVMYTDSMTVRTSDPRATHDPKGRPHTL